MRANHLQPDTPSCTDERNSAPKGGTQLEMVQGSGALASPAGRTGTGRRTPGELAHPLAPPRRAESRAAPVQAARGCVHGVGWVQSACSTRSPNEDWFYSSASRHCPARAPHPRPTILCPLPGVFFQEPRILTSLLVRTAHPSLSHTHNSLSREGYDKGEHFEGHPPQQPW